MLKVVLVLRQLLLRLKDSEVEVVIKKHKETISLGSHLKVQDGICHANLTTEFYLSSTDTSLNLQVIILQGSQRKLAGSTTLNILDYQEAVYHETISVLHNSPDKQARIFFNFVYFKDNTVTDKRPIFLSSDRYEEEYKNICTKNTMLMSENRQLERELCHEEMRNEALNMIKEERQMGIGHRDRAFREEVEFRHKNMEDWKYSDKTGKEELLQLAKARGLANKDKL